jgi:hypothetical protein
MGFFTWRATKQTKKQVRALRADQARNAQAQMSQAATLAGQARETELFQQLPPEGKEEFRVAQATYSETWNALSSWKHSGKAGKQAVQTYARAKEAVFRKYDLIP